MKIAVAVSSNMTSSHFGRSDEFYIYDVYDREIRDMKVERSPGESHYLIVPFLRDYNIEVVIAGCMGKDALDSLRAHGIKALTGAKGDPEVVLEEYISWSANLDENACVH